MSYLLLEGRQEGGGRGTESRGWGEGEEETELEETFRRFSPERGKAAVVGPTVPSLLKGSTFYSQWESLDQDRANRT